MRTTLRSLLVLLSWALFACTGDGLPSSGQRADLVLLGEHILSVDPATRDARAVAVVGEDIAAVGSRAEISRWIGHDTRLVELGERALAPGFIDAHGHLALVMQEIDFVNVSSPPVGDARRIDDILRLLEERIAERAPPPGEWVIGFGYDDSLLAEGRHPDRDDLDRVSQEHPIVLLHVSHHLASANSAALAAAGLGPDTQDPEGGVIRRRPQSREPNGVLEETAAMALFGQFAARGAERDFAADLLRAIAYHASFGITTIQDGASAPEWIRAVREVAARAPLPVDVAAYPHANAIGLEDGVDPEQLGYSASYANGFRVAGVKFALDGSPQGRTAWLTEPYDEGPPDADSDYVAYPILDPEQYLHQSAPLIAAGIPIIVHANGDAAIDLMIEGVARALGDRRPDHRSVAIHAQLTREDQLDRMRELGIVPSYFAAHPFFWGDWHRRSFGEDRAARISPLRSTVERGIPFTIHNDAPVVPPNVMRLLEIAVERRTRSGHVLGPEQRVGVEEALYGVTLGGAYAYFEEDRKGSITPGKRADLVILTRDPRDVPTHEIGAIEVVETLSRGRTVFRRDAAG